MRRAADAHTPHPHGASVTLLRRQLPVASPVSGPALIAGAMALVTGRGPDEAVGARVGEDLGLDDVLLTDSGTSALGLAVAGALRDRAPGTPVALPGYCCFDVATAADWADVPVVLYDVTPETLGPDLGSLRHALESGAGAVVVAHLYGIPADIQAARSAVEAAGAVLIEDAAQAAGATHGGRRLGGFGSVGVLSFGRGKGTTGGGGGALLAGDDRGRGIVTWARARLRRPSRGSGALIRLAAQWLLGRPAWYGLPARLPFLGLGQTVYRKPTPPRAVSPVHCAVLSRTLDLEAREIAERCANAARLRQAVPGGVVVPGPPPGAEATYLRLPIVPSRQIRADLLAAGVPLGVLPGYPVPLADLPGFQARLAGDPPALPGARHLARTLLTLPTHGLLTARDLEALERWLTRLS